MLRICIRVIVVFSIVNYDESLAGVCFRSVIESKIIVVIPSTSHQFPLRRKEYIVILTKSLHALQKKHRLTVLLLRIECVKWDNLYSKIKEKWRKFEADE